MDNRPRGRKKNNRQPNESETTETSIGLQGQSRIGSPHGREDGGGDCAGISSASDAGQPMEAGDRGTAARGVRTRSHGASRGVRTGSGPAGAEGGATDHGTGLA